MKDNEHQPRDSPWGSTVSRELCHRLFRFPLSLSIER